MHGMRGGLCAMQILFFMRHDVRSKFTGLIKKALAAEGNHRTVLPQDFAQELAGAPPSLVQHLLTY